MNDYELLGCRGSTLVSTLIGFGLIASAALIFSKSSQNFDYSNQKAEVKVFDKQLIVSKALALQNLSFDEVFKAAFSRGPDHLPVSCQDNVTTDELSANPSLNILNRWIALDEVNQYCLVINRWQLLGKGRILDIELKISLRKGKNGKVLSESLTHFRKAR